MCVPAQSTEILPLITLEKDLGGRLDGASWNSSEISGKTYVLFYVDPDEKNLNEHVADLINKENFSPVGYGSIGIINMAATWLPNFAIAASLKEKQKKFPTTLYLKDFKKTLVSKWNLLDDSSNIIVFDKNGRVLKKILGKATDEEALEIVQIIKKSMVP
jgi:hypothetical protein